MYENKDTLLSPNAIIPWLTLSPRCLLFNTLPNIGNFFNPKYMTEVRAVEEIGGRLFAWVLKTHALQHFEVNTHFEWSDEGFDGGNLMRLIQQEYRYEIQTMLATKVKTKEDVYKELIQRLLQNRELIGRFPIDLTNAVSWPNARVHMAVLQCNKGKPVNDVTLAHIDIRRAVHNVTEITPGMSSMLGRLS